MPFSRLLLPTDLSDDLDVIAADACAIAKASGAAITLLHVSESTDDRDDAVARLEALAATHPWCDFDPQVRVDVDADPAHAILNAARQIEADLIAMPTCTEHGIRWFSVGSVSDRVLRHSAVPVVLRRPTGSARSPAIRRVLMPTDFSADADRALSRSAGLLAELGAEVTLLHVVEERPNASFHLAGAESILELRPDLADRITTMLEDRARSYLPAIKVECLVTGSRTARRILAVAAEREIDMIVMATQGHDSIDDRFLGSTTERVARATEAALLVYPGERVTPI